MAPKKKNKGRRRRSKTPAQTSASDPKPTATSPSTSTPPGSATTTSLVPSSASSPPPSLSPRPRPCPSKKPITDLVGPSTAPTGSAANTRNPTLLPVKDDFMSFLAPAADRAMAAVQSAKKDDPEDLHLDDLESVLESFLGLANKMKGEGELKMASGALDNMEVLKRAVVVAEKLLAVRIKNLDGSGGSCGGSEGEGGGPDSGSGEGDGEGGGVSV